MIHIYYDKQDILCYFTGTYSEFISFLKENPDCSKV